MTRPLGLRDSPVLRIGQNQRAIGNETRKPVLGGSLIYVGTFVGPDDPTNDPLDASPQSPPWQNGFYYVVGSPVWFAHGVDGETDMGGMYDLVTGGPVSGDVAFEMPLEWASQAPQLHAFPIKLDDGVFSMAIQEITLTITTGEVRIWWPICADLCVT